MLRRRPARARLRHPAGLLDGDPRLAQAGPGHAARHGRAAPVRGRPAPRLQSALAAQLRRWAAWAHCCCSAGRPAQDDPERVFLIIVVALLWGVLARFLLSPQQSPAAGLSDRRRLRPALDADGASILLAGSSAAGSPCRSCSDFDVDRPVRAADRLRAGAGAVRAGHDRAVAPAGAVAYRSEQLRDRARNITLAVSMLFAALWLLWVFGAMTRSSGCSRWRSACPPRSASSTGRWTIS